MYDDPAIDLGYVSSRQLDMIIIGLQGLPQSADVKDLLSMLLSLKKGVVSWRRP